MNEITAAASVSAVRSKSAGADGWARQQPPIVVVGGVRQRAVPDPTDAEDAEQIRSNNALEREGKHMTHPIHLNPCCETTPELIPAVNTDTGKRYWIVHCFGCRREVISVSPEATAQRWNRELAA